MTVLTRSLQAGDKVLFIQLRAMGDSILSTPAIRDFKRTYPFIKIDFLAERLPLQALQNNTNLNVTIPAPSNRFSFSEYISLVYNIRKAEYSIVFDFLSTPGSALLTFLSGAPIRCGYDLRGRTWAYNSPVKRRKEVVYNPLTKYDLFDGFEVVRGSSIPELFPAKSDLNWADTRLQSTESGGGETLVAFAPWSKRSWRRWSPDNWIKLIQSLRSGGNYRFLLFASRNELEDLEVFLQSENLWVEWAGTESILNAAALIKKCDLYLGADNGIKHIAVAMGTPSLTIYTNYPGVAPNAWNPPYTEIHKYLITCSIDDELENEIAQIIDIVNNLQRVNETEPE